MLPGISASCSSLAFLYLVGMLWTALSWIRTIHESHAAANISSGRRSEKNRENALRKSARNTFKEGLWCIPFWPVLVIRNLKSVLAVSKDYYAHSKNETHSRQ